MQPGQARQETTGSARSPLAVVLDRHLFLHALQYQRPDFWRGFHHCLHHAPELDSEGYVLGRWADLHGVVDPWFIDVLVDTAADWRTHPESERAKLVADREWFTYNGRNHAVLPFALEFENPWPMLMSESQTLETPDQFDERLTGQIRQAMKEYKTYIRSTGQSPANRRRDAHWTALRFTGASAQEIARVFEMKPYKDPEPVIYKAVERFSNEIGLTLRSR